MSTLKNLFQNKRIWAFMQEIWWRMSEMEMIFNNVKLDQIFAFNSKKQLMCAARA